MYNGIGLLTPRGSGTSGYVQTNKFNLRVSPQLSMDETERNSAPKHKKPNVQIIEHNRKREIELKVEEMRVLLEDQGYGPEEMESMLENTREELVTAAALAAQAKNERAGQETHELALRKENQMKNLQDAFGLKDAVEGQSFDRELQEQKRLERLAEREAREKEKERLRREEEERRKMAAKEAKKAAKAAKKAEEADKKLHKGKNPDGQQARFDGKHVQHGKYVAKSPEPQPSRAVPNDDRFQPREASAELEVHPDTALLYPEAAPHREGQFAIDKNARVRRRDASPSVFHKRQRRESPHRDRHTHQMENGLGRDNKLDQAVLHHNREHSRKQAAMSNPVQDGHLQDRLRGSREALARDGRGHDSGEGNRSADGPDRHTWRDKGRTLRDERISDRQGHSNGRAGRDYRPRSDDVDKDRRDDRGYTRSSRDGGHSGQDSSRRADRDRYEERRASRSYHEARYQEANEGRHGRYQDRDVSQRRLAGGYERDQRSTRDAGHGRRDDRTQLMEKRVTHRSSRVSTSSSDSSSSSSSSLSSSSHSSSSTSSASSSD